MSYIRKDNENGKNVNEDAMEVIDRYHLDGLKRKKTQAKAACTRTRKRLISLMVSDLPSRIQTREALQQIDDAQQVTLEIMVKIADEYKSCNDLKNFQKVTSEMEDIEEITTEVTERAQIYLDSRRDEASSIATSDSFRRNINNNWGQKTEVKDLQSARYQGNLEAVMDRFDQLKAIEEAKKRLSIKSSSEKMEPVDANQKAQPADMNDQQYKQPWMKSNQLTAEGKGSVSAISLNKKAVRSINSFNNGELSRNTNPGRLRDKERRLIHIRPSQGNEFIIENEDDELIQTRRKRVDKFVSKCNRRPQPQVPERRQE